jgi:hypothetical protein
MNARYYLPQIGRFVSPDSIVPDPANPQSFNRYAYVRNNPINLSDPTGHMECSGIQGECGYPTPVHNPSQSSSSPTSPGGSSPAGKWIKTTLASVFDTVAVKAPRVQPAPSSPGPGIVNLTEWLVGQMGQTAQSPVAQILHALWTLPGPAGQKALVLASWTRLVSTGAIWDFKSDIRESELPTRMDDLIQLGNHAMNYQAVANIFYGFIGRQIGMGETLLQGGAGAAQLEQGVGNWQGNLAEYPAGFGDQPFDAWAIGFGFELHAQFGQDVNSLTVTAFTAALDAYISTHLPPSGP